MAAELEDSAPPSEVLAASVQAVMVLLAPDQDPEIQRTTLQTLRRIARLGSGVLEPVYPTIVPSLCALTQTAQAQTKLAVEFTLGEVLHLGQGQGAVQALLTAGTAGPLARQVLTDSYVRKLARQQEETDWASDREEDF